MLGANLQPVGEALRAQLDLPAGQGLVVEGLRGDGACVLLSQLEPGQHSLRPLHKERHRGNVRQDFASWQVVQVGHLQRRDRECIFPPDVQQRTAGHQELELRT